MKRRPKICLVLAVNRAKDKTVSLRPKEEITQLIKDAVDSTIHENPFKKYTEGKEIYRNGESIVYMVKRKSD